jgi:hypothetical protein
VTELSLPFWMVLDRSGEAVPVAFTTTEKLSAFLDRDQSGSWSISLIADPAALFLAVADIHQQGAKMVWVDPAKSHSDSDSIRLVDLLELSQRLGAA